ncbi:MAG: glycosyltransferase family 4 protein [Elusimicrobiota bacterium]
MKILQIIDIPWNSGITSYAIELSKGLAKKGHKIFFASLKNGLPNKLAQQAGFETINICSRKNPFVFDTVFQLAKFIQMCNIDIVNAYTGKCHFLAYLVLLISAKKFAIIRTKSDALYPKKSFLYKKTKKVIAASEFIRKQYLEIGLEPEKVVTIYQGIDTSVHEFTNSRVHEFIVGIVGRLDPVKGHRYFLEAAKIVLRKIPDTKFLIAGKEENIKYSELKKLSEKLGIEKSVEFFGYVEDVYKFMSECSLGVVTSTGSEAVSRVLLEWMACGKVVIATSVGCIPEILDETALVPPFNAEILAQRILKFLETPSLMKNIAETNRKKIEKEFGYEKFMADTERIFNSVL